MFEWLFGKRQSKIEEEIKESFSAVKRDMDLVGKWIKHLDGQDKHLFKAIHDIRHELSTIKEEISRLHGVLEGEQQMPETKQLFEKTPVLPKQTAVDGVEKAVQTAVQTGSFYDIFKSLGSQERLVLFTLMNSDMKLSYEDLALLLGKERSTIRGQINSIKQKSEGLIQEISEKNGKKRVFVPDEIKEKLAKYAKVRIGKKRKVRTMQVLEGIG